MDQSLISGQEVETSMINHNHQSPLSLHEKKLKKDRSAKPFQRYELIVRIFDLIDTLSESKRIDCLKKLTFKNLAAVLQKLIIDLPENELANFHEELQKIGLGKRAHPRKKCIMTADYRYEDRPYCDFVKDISESGAFIYTQVDFEIGDEIVHSYYLSNRQLPIQFTGEVVRSDQSGVGIRFIKQSNYHKDILKSFLSKIE